MSRQWSPTSRAVNRLQRSHSLSQTREPGALPVAQPAVLLVAQPAALLVAQFAAPRVEELPLAGCEDVQEDVLDGVDAYGDDDSHLLERNLLSLLAYSNLVEAAPIPSLAGLLHDAQAHIFPQDE